MDSGRGELTFEEVNFLVKSYQTWLRGSTDPLEIWGN